MPGSRRGWPLTSVLTPPLSAVESLCQTTWPVLPGQTTAATIAKTATPSIAAVTAVISAASAAPVTVATIVTVAAAAVGTNAVALAAADATAQEPASVAAAAIAAATLAATAAAATAAAAAATAAAVSAATAATRPSSPAEVTCKAIVAATATVLVVAAWLESFTAGAPAADVVQAWLGEAGSSRRATAMADPAAARTAMRLAIVNSKDSSQAVRNDASAHWKYTGAILRAGHPIPLALALA